MRLPWLATVLATSGMRLTVADWVPKRDKDFGWWGVVLAGKSSDKRVNWSNSNDPLLLPPGRYDVYWQQDSDHTPPMLLASGVTVQQDHVVDIQADSGIQIEVADRMPKRNKKSGWWGAALAGHSPDNLVNWSHANDPLLLPPGQYDVYWKQDFYHESLLLASSITLDHGQVAQVKASPRI